MSGTGARHVNTAEEARSLAAHLLDGSRLRPCVVVSTAAGQAEPYADVDKILTDVGDLGEVYVLATGEASWAFSNEMPQKTQVYGGASRGYPVDLSWRDDPLRSPLRFAYGRADRERVTDLLVGDALAMALSAGLVERHRAGAPTMPAAGEVLGVTGNRAIVTTDRGTGSIVPELTVEGVPAERLFRKGMRVAGQWDSRERRLDVAASLIVRADLLRGYSPGRQVLGRITRLDDGGCHIELVPHVKIFVPAARAVASGDTRLTSVMSLGEVVRVSVVAVGESTGKGWQLSLIDVDPDESPYAVALLPEGPPWLELPSRVAEAPEAPEVELPASLMPVPASPAPESEFEALLLERDELLERLSQMERRTDRLDTERERLRTSLREAQNALVGERRRGAGFREAAERAENDRSLFADPLEQLDFEIRLAWARRIPAAEKRARPLAIYHVGPDFLSSLAEINGVDRTKVVDVIVEVLTGLVHELSGRDSHQLRTDTGGNSSFVHRPDGATCWRVALQQQTPQARRLHYWQMSDKSVELSSVRNHDDFRP